jgi:hypothetical protein
MNRCKEKMAEALGVISTEGGFRDKVELENFRK